MKVLWLCNVPTQSVGKCLDIKASVGGGWLESLSSMIGNLDQYKLHFCFFSGQIRFRRDGVINNIFCHALPGKDSRTINKAKEALVNLLREIKPDVIHLFGSEYLTSYAMALACEEQGLLDRTLLHIQGLVSVSSRHYDAGIPWLWKHLLMPRDFLKNASIAHGKRDFSRRGKYEIESIKLLKHVSGRTDWDRACTYHINRQAVYHFCNETLRESFYQHRWDIRQCELHSIFVSQGSYPVKGLHFMLEALPLILKHYPDTCLYVGGSDPTAQGGSTIAKLKRTSYGQYLLHLIKKYDLSAHVEFTGPLDELQMCNRYLKSHVFVSASSIENSPNSVGEAMLLGMPVVSSYVGGVPSMLKDKEEGFLYQADSPYMLAYYVMKVFEKDEMAIRMGKQARIHALKTHSADINLGKLLEIYSHINNDGIPCYE